MEGSMFSEQSLKTPLNRIVIEDLETLRNADLLDDDPIIIGKNRPRTLHIAGAIVIAVLSVVAPILLVANVILFDQSPDRYARAIANRGYPFILILCLVIYLSLIIRFAT